MALDTRGLASGFAQGFGLADNYYNRQAQNERADRSMEMREEAFGMQKDEANRKRTQEMAQFTLGKIAQGMEPSEEEFKFLQEHPEYWPAFDEQTDQDIEIAQRVIDPDDPLDSNDPEALYAMNHLFDHRINRGDGGRKRIAGLYPGTRPDTVTVDLEVEGEDGSKRNAPMTRNRGVEGDDEVLETPVENLVNQVQGYRVLRNAFRTPEAQATANKVLAALTGKRAEPTKGININGQLVNPTTGEQMGDFRTPEQRGDKGSGKAPADVQTAEWMVANGMAPDLDVAWNRINESRSDPARFVNDFVTQEMKFQETSGVFPGDESYRAPEQMREQAIETLAMIRARTRGTGLAEPEPAPQGLEITGARAEVLPEDGSAVPQNDGSYRGQVDRTERPAQAQQQPQMPDEQRMQQATTVRERFRAGEISREEAVNELRNLGFE